MEQSSGRSISKESTSSAEYNLILDSDEKLDRTFSFTDYDLTKSNDISPE